MVALFMPAPQPALGSTGGDSSRACLVRSCLFRALSVRGVSGVAPRMRLVGIMLDFTAAFVSRDRGCEKPSHPSASSVPINVGVMFPWFFRALEQNCTRRAAKCSLEFDERSSKYAVWLENA